MAERYLLPEDIGAGDAAMVLEFLNAALDAAEIAAAVEIPGELDIGPRVAARIVARRDQLGGFTALEQVYAVPYVGPERFTELVTSLSGARPPRAMGERVDGALLAQLSQRLDTLEARFGATSTIRLSAMNPDALLGQHSVLLAELKDGEGRPLIDRELTMVTTWGRLEGRAGVRPVEGNSISVRSDHLGLCKVRLTAALGEELSPVETASLGSALALLGTPGDAPRGSLTELTELARRYRESSGAALRRAVDVYFKRYGDTSLASVPIDSLATWPRIGITVIAWLTPEREAATSRIPTALLNLHQRNWFYAWLWAYRQLLESDSTLGASLADIRSDQRSGGAILSDLFGRVGTFVKTQDGLVGQQLGQHFAAMRLNGFLQTQLASLPVDERVRVVTGVTSGVKSLDANIKQFAAFEGSRADLNLAIDSRLAGTGRTALLDTLESRIAQIEQNSLTVADLNDIRTEILADAARATDLQVETIEESFSRELATKADATRVDSLDQQVVTLASDTQAFDARLAGLDTRVDSVDTRVKDIDRRVPRQS
jgi:hypothetical protein